MEIVPLRAFVCLVGRKGSTPGKTNPEGLEIQTLCITREKPPTHIFVVPFSGVCLGVSALFEGDWNREALRMLKMSQRKSTSAKKAPEKDREKEEQDAGSYFTQVTSKRESPDTTIQKISQDSPSCLKHK